MTVWGKRKVDLLFGDLPPRNRIPFLQNAAIIGSVGLSALGAVHWSLGLPALLWFVWVFLLIQDVRCPNCGIRLWWGRYDLNFFSFYFFKSRAAERCERCNARLDIISDPPLSEPSDLKAGIAVETSRDNSDS